MKTRSHYKTNASSAYVSSRLRPRDFFSELDTETETESESDSDTSTSSDTDTDRNFFNAPTSSLAKSIKKANKKQTITPPSACNFCFTDKKNDHLLGELRQSATYGITAHKYCLYFSSGLSQNDSLTSHFWGFKPKDIFKELRRGASLKCSYCNKKGAVIGCNVSHCMVMFHLPCGINNEAINYYHQDDGLYPSYCKNHRPKSSLPEFEEPVLCTICQEHMNNSDRPDMMFIKCCNSYFHSQCLKDLAFHYEGDCAFKCPNCNNEELFLKTIKKAGFLIPLIAEAMLFQTPREYTPVRFQCCAPECMCENGREYNGNDNWELFTCDRCGSAAIHVACANMNEENMEWICQSCQN